MKLLLALVSMNIVFAQRPHPLEPTEQERNAALRRLRFDWAGLSVYGSEDSELPDPAPGENRVIIGGEMLSLLFHTDEEHRVRGTVKAW